MKDVSQWLMEQYPSKLEEDKEIEEISQLVSQIVFLKLSQAISMPLLDRWLIIASFNDACSLYHLLL